MADVPCSNWCTTDQVREVEPASKFGGREWVFQTAVDTASAWLYRLTGRQFSGTCTITVAPVSVWPTYTRPDRLDPIWFDSRNGTYRQYGNRQLWGRGEWAYEITLGNGPIRAVTNVTIDGVTLDPSKYRVDDERYLVRQDGNPWPYVNDFTKPAGAVGTWSVTYSFGQTPPSDGVQAAVLLAVELLRARLGDDACKLPDRVQSVSRQGVTLTMLDPNAFLDKGRLGIPEIDAFVQSVNPYSVAERAQVISPDIGRAIRRVGT